MTDLSDLDIVIPVREGANEELRYALRTIAANVPHRAVWIVGGKPNWCTGVEHLRHTQRSGKYQNVRNARRLAAEHPDISDTFMLWNDDIYAMEPVADLPRYHRGSVASVLAAFRLRVGESPYVLGMAETKGYLEREGIETPLSYELHVPVALQKDRLLDVLDRGEAQLRLPHVRTLYGNLHGEPGPKIDDVKVHSMESEIPRGPWLSSSDDTFRYGVGNVVRYLFGEPSRFER